MWVRVAACLAAAAIAAPAFGGPAAAAAPGCTVTGHAIAGIAGSRVLASGGVSVVYRVRGPHADRWYACRRGDRARTSLGVDRTFQMSGAEYGPARTMRLARAAGGWAVAVAETGLTDYATCGKFTQYPCTGPTETLIAARAGAPAAGRLTTFTTDTSDDTGAGTDVSWRRLLLSPAGGVAWLLASRPFTPSASGPPVLTLYGCVLAAGPACTPRQLATGAIDPASVTLAGTTVTWTAGGASQSAAL